MLTEKDYCDYDICVALKKFGLKWDCDENDMLECKAARPSLYIAQKFLREEKKIEVNATYDNVVELHWHWYMKSLTNRNQTTSIINYDSYEQALLAGIKEAIEILKENETIHE